MVAFSKARENLDSYTVPLSGGDLFVRTNAVPPPSTAPTVVMVHGFIVAGVYMTPVAHYLAADYRLYIPDMPGYGMSYKPEHALGVPQLAEALLEWMDVQKIESAHILSNSYGCQIAAEFAARFPERVDRVVLAGPTVDPRSHRAILQGSKWFANMAFEPPKMGLLMARDYLAAGNRILRETIYHCLNDRIEQKLPRIQAPTLVLRGGRDPLVPRRWAREAAALCPRGYFKEIPGQGHTVNFNAPLELFRLVDPFFAGAEDPPPCPG